MTQRVEDSNQRLMRGLPERRYLPELHGVRGVALLGVVLFHLFGSGKISGGIDIFLAISGFLFTGMLLRESAAKGGPVDLFKYFGRLFRRIVAPAATVALATLALALVILPVTQHRQLWTEARASILYFENIELINSQLTYDAAGPDTSPFQHFWSLSVQGQFYLVWPFVAILSVLIARLIKRSAAGVMATLAGLIVVVSLGYAIYVGSYNQDEAYLMTQTRAWQLAFGALIALAGSKIRLPKKLRGVGGWLGFALIVSCGFLLDGRALFPGPWAFWPILGLTLVLISAGPEGGNKDPKWSATSFLTNKVFAWIGDRAYGLYLWHWPLLIFYMEIADKQAINVIDGLGILAVSFVIASIMYKLLEQPLSRATKKANAPGGGRRNKYTVVAGVVTIGLVGVGTTAFAPTPPELKVAYEGLDADKYPGAAQAFQDEPPAEEEIFPEVEYAQDYMPEYVARGCRQEGNNVPGTDEVLICEDEDPPANPTATIVLAGGSHAGHFEAAFKALGDKYGWEVIVAIKSGCVFGLEENPDHWMCGQWNENFIEWLDTQDVDLVVTPGTRLWQPENVLADAPYWWEQITDTGADLLLTRGTPRGMETVPDCLASGGTAQECGLPKANIAEVNPLLEMDLPEGTHLLDLTEYVCPAIDDDSKANCDAVVGNLLVWYDTDHFTVPFSQSLAPAIEEELSNTLPTLFR